MFIDMEQDAAIVSLFVNKGGRKFLIASHEGQGSIVNEDDCVGNTRKGKQVLNVEMPNEARAVTTVAGDMVAVIGTNHKMVIFPIDQVPEMARGRGVRLQKYTSAGLSDVVTFDSKSGLTWKDSAGREQSLSSEGAVRLARQPRRCRPAGARPAEVEQVRARRRVGAHSSAARRGMRIACRSGRRRGGSRRGCLPDVAASAIRWLNGFAFTIVCKAADTIKWYPIRRNAADVPGGTECIEQLVRWQRCLSVVLIDFAHAQSGKPGVEKLYILNCGEGVAGDISRWSPGVNEGKSMDFVDNCYLIKHAQGWFLWDTGVMDSVAAMPNGLAPAIRSPSPGTARRPWPRSSSSSG